MKTANGVILLPHRPLEASTTYTHSPPLSADWSEEDGSSLFATSGFLPRMSPFSFFLLLIAMMVVVSVGIRIALLNGRTTGPMMRWQQQTPLSPLAFNTGGRRKGARNDEESSDEEMALDEKRMTLEVPKEEGVWRLG